LLHEAELPTVIVCKVDWVITGGHDEVGDGDGGVGVGEGGSQITETAMLSTRHPVPLPLLSDAIRKRSLINCPPTAPRFATVLTYSPKFPLQALRPAIGLMKDVEIVALYPPVTKLPPTAGSVMSVKAPPLILGEETSKTAPSKLFSRL